MIRRLLTALAAGSLMGAAGCSQTHTTTSTDPSASGSERAVVDHVVDGDTLDVRVNGRLQRVRTVQIDAPESSSTPYGRPDRCGAPAKRFAQSLTGPGRTVTLEFAGRDRTDSYGRLLAIVGLGDSRAVTWQERMVRSGWADVLVVGGNRTPLLSALRRDAAYAKAHRLGVWAECDGHFHDPGDRGGQVRRAATGTP
jgi:micrococcal nuclease